MYLKYNIFIKKELKDIEFNDLIIYLLIMIESGLVF